MSYTKKMAKNALLFYAGHELRQASREMKATQIRMREERNNPPTPPAPPKPKYDFGVYEHTVVTTVNVVSSLLETVLAEGIDVNPRTMRDAQDLLNGLQELLDIKKGY